MPQSRCTTLDALCFAQMLYRDEDQKLCEYQVAQSSTAGAVASSQMTIPYGRARERASRPTEIAVCEAPAAAEEALATTDACVEGAQ